jgi:SSS family solute:Na+ symporter
MDYLYLISIFVYLLVLTGIGIYKSRSVKTQDDFSVAGRTLSPWIMVCTMLAVWIGTGSIVGNAGQAFRDGMATLILPIGTFFGMIILSQIASRARKIEATSVPEIIGARYGHAARLLSVVALIIAYMVIVSYQFNAGGMVLEVILTDEAGNSLLTAQTATIIAAIFIITYTMLAGLMSLAFTDIVTGTIITVSLLIAFPVLLYKAGGFSGMEAAFAAMPDRSQHMQFWGVYSSTQIINYCLPVFLLLMGDANQYQRIFASKNAKGAKSAVTTMIFVALVVELLIIASAWVASSMIPDPANGKYVLIYAAKHFMPMVLGTLFLVTVVGIIISTADSFLLVPATTFMKDIYLTYINPKAAQKKVVFLSRMLVLAFGIIAYIVSLAFAQSTTVFQKALYAYTVYGSAITPCLIAALFWKRATKAGAISSILAGTVTTLLWEEVLKKVLKAHVSEELAQLDAVLPAITLSVICLIVVSLLTYKKDVQADVEHA